MKRLNLNETWVLCLKQWPWITQQIEAGREGVVSLKLEWCKMNGFENVQNNCFFCEWSLRHGGGCNCPAKKIDKEFDCETIEYHYALQPLKFYKRISQLNNLRKKKENRNV